MTPVARRIVRESAATIHEAARKRPIIVTLEPPGRMIGFRPKWTRKTYYLPIDWCYARAVQAHVPVDVARDRPPPADPHAGPGMCGRVNIATETTGTFPFARDPRDDAPDAPAAAESPAESPDRSPLDPAAAAEAPAILPPAIASAVSPDPPAGHIATVADSASGCSIAARADGRPAIEARAVAPPAKPPIGTVAASSGPAGHVATIADSSSGSSVAARTDGRPAVEAQAVAPPAIASPAVPDLAHILPPAEWLSPKQRRAWLLAAAAYREKGLSPLAAEQEAMVELVMTGRLSDPGPQHPFPDRTAGQKPDDPSIEPSRDMASYAKPERSNSEHRPDSDRFPSSEANPR